MFRVFLTRPPPRAAVTRFWLLRYLFALPLAVRFPPGCDIVDTRCKCCGLCLVPRRWLLSLL